MNPVTINKVCTRCGKNKPTDQFNKRAKAKDGLRFTCKACDKDVHKGWNSAQKGGSPEVLTTGSGGAAGSLVEAGGMAPIPRLPISVTEPEPVVKIIGRIGGQAQTPTPRIREVSLDPLEEAEQKAAREYADLLNRKLSVRHRANLMVKIAKNIQGPTAALALQAIKDINMATGVTSKTGAQIDLGPLFLMPEGTSMAMKGGGKGA